MGNSGLSCFFVALILVIASSKTAALTGGIASGKSTVSHMFQELGAYLIDADLVARQVVEPEKAAWQEIVEFFGQGILLPDKQIDRKQLGRIIFHHADKRKMLNQIVHPRVIAEINQQEHHVHQHDPETFVMVDVPLLIEASMYSDYAHIILVYVPETIQLQRLMRRDNISRQEALARIRSQMSLEEKRRYATHIIMNDADLDDTRKQVTAVYQALA